MLDALHRLYEIQDIESLPKTMLAVTDTLVPNVNVTFDIIDAANGKADYLSIRPLQITLEESLARWKELHHEHPCVAHLEKGGQVSTYTLTDFASQRQLQGTAFYNEILQALDSSHQLGVILPVPGHIVGMTINRDRDFTDDERECMALLHPHLTQAFKNAQLFTSLRGSPEVDYHAWRNKGLTHRECEVLRWLMEGKRNSEISVILDAKPRTIGKHVENIFGKLGVETRSAAGAEARRLLKVEAPLPQLQRE